MIPDIIFSPPDSVFNAIYIKGDRGGPTLFYGQGGRKMPTGSAVVKAIWLNWEEFSYPGERRRVPLLSYQPSSSREFLLKKIADSRMPFYLRFSKPLTGRGCYPGLLRLGKNASALPRSSRKAEG